MARPEPGSERRKQTFYLAAQMIEEVQREARRLDRPASWIAQRAWEIARERIRAMPAVGQEPSEP